MNSLLMACKCSRMCDRIIGCRSDCNTPDPAPGQATPGAALAGGADTLATSHLRGRKRARGTVRAHLRRCEPGGNLLTRRGKAAVTGERPRELLWPRWRRDRPDKFGTA